MGLEVPAAEAAILVIKERKELLTGVRRFLDKQRNGELHILVFGASGTGKTTAGLFLSGALTLMAAPPPYVESAGTERFTIAGKKAAAVHVAAGQQLRRRQWDELYDLASDAKSIGLIQVVSYGYHAIDPIAARVAVQLPRDDQTLLAYIESRREAEVRSLQAVVSNIRKVRKPTWMVTLINKEDLWFNSRNDVINFYRSNDYHSHIESMTKKLGERLFSHQYVAASLWMSNLTFPGQEFKVLTTAGYDQHLQTSSLIALCRTIDSLSGRTKLEK